MARARTSPSIRSRRPTWSRRWTASSTARTTSMCCPAPSAPPGLPWAGRCCAVPAQAVQAQPCPSFDQDRADACTRSMLQARSTPPAGSRPCRVQGQRHGAGPGPADHTGPDRADHVIHAGRHGHGGFQAACHQWLLRCWLCGRAGGTQAGQGAFLCSCRSLLPCPALPWPGWAGSLAGVYWLQAEQQLVTAGQPAGQPLAVLSGSLVAHSRSQSWR